jgi:signal transduction histidine kinase
MRIQERLILGILFVFLAAFSVFVLATWNLPRTIQNKTDAQLQALSGDILEEAARKATPERPFNPTHLSWPQETGALIRATFLYLVLDESGKVIATSPNLPTPLPAPDPAPRSPTPFFTTRSLDGHVVRIFTRPIMGQSADGTVLLGYLQTARIVDHLASYNRYTLTIIFIGAATLSLIMFFISRFAPMLLAPLHNINAVASRISSADDLGRRIPVQRDDELGQLATTINQLLERLEKLFRSQQQLLADVSHELRTPLTAIRGNVDLMRRLKTPDPESLDAIEQETARMSRLVNDLLTLARAEVGGLPIRRDVINLDTIFLGVYEQLSVIRTPIRVILQEVAPVQVLGDADRLRQLLLNLMTNAIKYTNSGGTVTVGLKHVQKRAVIEVRDTGIGIPADDLPRVFDRFYRVNKARTRERGGAGLGLAIAKSIALAHEGDIRVRSEVGVGTVFTVELPALEEFSEWDEDD